MRKAIGRMIGGLVIGMMLASVLSCGAAMAMGGADSLAVSTSILPEDWCIGQILMLVVNVLVYGLGAAATLGVIIAGVMYMTARDSEQQVAAAKKRLIEIAVGLIAWALMYTLLNWLIPGGLDLNNAKVLCPDKTSSIVTDEATACLL